MNEKSNAGERPETMCKHTPLVLNISFIYSMKWIAKEIDNFVEVECGCILQMAK